MKLANYGGERFPVLQLLFGSLIGIWLLFIDAGAVLSQNTDPKDATGFYLRGLDWAEKGELDKAIADYGEAIRLDPMNASRYSTRGMAWNDKGEYDKALADFNEALRLDPKDEFAYHGRGWVWYNKGEYDKAIADFNESIRLDAKSASKYNGRGLSWHNKKEYDKAIADYNAAIRLDPKFTDPHDNLAFLYSTASDLKKRDAQKALALAEKALAIDDKDGYAMSAKACALALSGDFTAAIELETKALEDQEFAKDKAFDGGTHAQQRIERWKAKTLWLDSMAKNPAK